VQAARRLERLAGMSAPEGIDRAAAELKTEIDRLLPVLIELAEKPTPNDS
jgi:hypothetical protein